MIEQIILEYLSENLSIPVKLEEEPNLPPEYVLIEKTGSGDVDKRQVLCL